MVFRYCPLRMAIIRSLCSRNGPFEYAQGKSRVRTYTSEIPTSPKIREKWGTRFPEQLRRCRTKFLAETLEDRIRDSNFYSA